MEFNLTIKLDEGWYDEIAFEDVVKESARKAVSDWVRSQTIEYLETEKGLQLAVQNMLDNGMYDQVKSIKL